MQLIISAIIESKKKLINRRYMILSASDEKRNLVQIILFIHCFLLSIIMEIIQAFELKKFGEFLKPVKKVECQVEKNEHFQCLLQFWIN